MDPLNSAPNLENYRVFAIVAAGNSKSLPCQAVCVGKCDAPADASQLVQEALNSNLIVTPEFVLLVPESQFEVPFSQS